MPSYLYNVAEGAVWVHTFAASEATLTLPEGQQIHIVQRTRYPWDGQVILEMLAPGQFTLNVRIPSWCDAEEGPYKPTVRVNDGPCPGDVTPGQYVSIRRTWAIGDSVCVQLPMRIRRVQAHPYVLENAGRVALMRGPVLYCLEGVDHPGVDLRDIVLPVDAELSSAFRADLLGGTQVIEGRAGVSAPDAGWASNLYRSDQPEQGNTESVDICAVPYFLWANRKPGAMQVWLRSR
jgi:DUF1680 family protein